MSTIDVASGEIFSGTLNAGDTFIVEDGGQSRVSQIYGTEIIEAGGGSSSDTVYAGGTITADQGPNFESAEILGGTVDLTADSNESSDFGDAFFSGPGGLLEVNATERYYQVTGFEPFIDHIDPGDAISLAGLPTDSLSYHIVGENNVVVDSVDPGTNDEVQTKL